METGFRDFCALREVRNVLSAELSWLCPYCFYPPGLNPSIQRPVSWQMVVAQQTRFLCWQNLYFSEPGS
jgi:hypothetical protein